jgi:pimeloyl-ACP methyl ester carboxylesterase
MEKEFLIMKKKCLVSSLPLLFFFAIVSSYAAENVRFEPLVIQEQGSFAVGGTVLTAPGTFDPNNLAKEDGQTFHGDHAYVFYQIPANPRKFPLVFLHGAGQFSRTWETTPDGREGFQNIFLRRGFATYLLDQPRRGGAGRSTLSAEPKPIADEQMWFTIFRLGNWPDFHPSVQFPRDEESLNQYFRQMTPNTGPYDDQIISDAIAALFDKLGDGILVTHSQGGGPGWYTAIKSTKVRAVISYEPGAFFFPEGEVPTPLPSFSPFWELKGVGVPMEDFIKLTKLPIVLYFGDNIPEEPTDDPGKDNWRARLQMAKSWVAAINKYGGNAKLVHLPKIGITGNTHFPFSDLNNIEVADQMSKFLKENGLDFM